MLDPAIKDLAKAANFAALSTLLPGGQPMTQMMWVHADDDYLLINTEVGRQKYRNVQRDPRVTIAVIDRGNPYHYAEVRGRVVGEIAGDQARANIDELSLKYTGQPYDPNAIGSARVILQIEPERQRIN